MKKLPPAEQSFQKLVEIISKLRSPGGCPWDRVRTKQEILNYFLEEVYEAAEALNSNNPEAAREELGDVLMEVVFLVRFYEEEGLFTMAEVLEGINNKMIERHPHVFKYKKKTTSKAVIDTWQKNKQKEKNRDSILDGLPASAPALIYAFLLGQRAAGCGFDWPSPAEALEKVKEEITELEKSLKLKKQNQVAEELGDVMFSLVNVCRLLNLNPEIVLHQANKKFEKRFRLLEKELTRKGQKVQPHSTAELDRLWEQVKKDSLEIGKRPVLKKKSLGEKKQKG